MRFDWTPEQDQFVLDNWGKISAKDIGSAIGRTESSIYNRTFRLNLRRKQNPVTSGQIFGSLVVLNKSNKRTPKGQAYFLCQCDCGKQKEILGCSLNRGLSVSCGCKVRQREGQVTINSYLDSYKRGAKKRNLEFVLTDVEFRNICEQNCHYCNLEPQPKNHYQRRKENIGRALPETYEEAWVNLNGIDRKDNKLGYTLENSLPCCSICNWAKGDMSYDEFKDWIKRLCINNP